MGKGDSSAFPSLIQWAPYGLEKIEKKEYVRHIHKKHMGSWLRKLRVDCEGKLLSDGKKSLGKTDYH